MGKQGGVNAINARRTCDNVDRILEQLASNIKKMVQDIDSMNSTYWYGGPRINTWYKNVSVTIDNLVTVYNNFVNLNNQYDSNLKTGRSSGVYNY